MNTIEFYDLEKIKEIDYDFPDIYFTSKYGQACEYSDQGAIWECCIYKDLIYVYLKRPHNLNNQIYYDLITPYGYSGYYFLDQNTFNEFLPLFREKVYERNYVSEIVRQNPYLDLNLTGYNILSERPIFGIQVNDFEYYFNKVLNSKVRNIFRKAEKNGMTFSLKEIKRKSLSKDTQFRKLYHQTMDKVCSKPYYYFNDQYFNQLEMFNSYLALVKNQHGEIIGASIIFVFKDFIHYHLSCNDNSSNCITEFLLINVVKELGMNKTFILGGGLKEGDSLHKFKSKLSNKQYSYKIYKNIINQEIYDQILLT